MVVLVVVLAVVAMFALVLTVLSTRRLAEQRRLAAAAEERATAREAELAATAAELESATTERLAAASLAEARAEQLTRAEEHARLAADEARLAAERAEAAERESAALREAGAAASDGIDPAVLWILERARSERTWRFSVAPHPESPTVFGEDANPLLAAVQVELDAAREDVGAVVELDAEIPDGITVAASVLALRATQELLADVVRRSEETTVRIRADGDDLVIDIEALDEYGQPVMPTPLPLPPSPAVDVTATGVRVRDAIAPVVGGQPEV